MQNNFKKSIFNLFNNKFTSEDIDNVICPNCGSKFINKKIIKSINTPIRFNLLMTNHHKYIWEFVCDECDNKWIAYR